MQFQPVALKAGQVPSSNPTILDLHSIGSNEANLIHLLCGVSVFESALNGKRIVPKVNYSVLGMPKAKRGKKALRIALATQSIDIEKLNQVLLAGLVQADFFEELFDEFARFVYFSLNKKHTQAFLHLYRALERVSYAFPIAYAAKSNDFKGTFASLRSYLIDDKTAELGFFKAFTKEVVDSTSLNTIVRFDFTSCSAQTKIPHYDSFKKMVGRDANCVANSYIEIKYDNVLSAFINLRNRYFHFMSGNAGNLTGKNILDSDEFFSVVNPIFANWLSYIYFRVLEVRAK